MPDSEVVQPVPTAEKTTEVHEKTSGPQPVLLPTPPPIVADDNARKYIALITLFSYGCFISLVVWLLVFHSDKISPVVATLIGAILGTQANNVSSVYQYYFGSSSGSTSKQALLDRKDP